MLFWNDYDGQWEVISGDWEFDDVDCECLVTLEDDEPE